MAGRRREAETTRFDSLLWQFADLGQDLGSLAEAVSRASGSPAEQIAVETVIVGDANPLTVIAEFVAGDLRTVGLVSLLRVEDEHGPFVLGAWPTAHDGVFHLVGSVPTTDPRWRKVERWVVKAAPEIVPVFLDHDDFADIGTALSEFGEVEVSRLTARKRSDLSSLNRGWAARSGSLRPSHHEAIGNAEAEGASVRTLTLHIAERISLHLRRRAGATFYNGDFRLFDRVVLGRLATAAFRRRALMAGRERRVDAPPPEPISIRLPAPILIDAEATGEVLAELERQRGLVIAVLHRNPYLHVVVTDSADGSNFDVFVTTPDAIEVHPGFRSSLGALTRLTQNLGERFEALEITEAKRPESVSLDDLVVPF
ncbi:hypothetical protein [Blastococcus sp. TF02A-30]|uniref:hypothetical protein n=1 Tax=Blastococcus sp. TF02A-30 TaxID=2250580 RepID=UPI000DE93609|nr:hypothetical protein [Blastococcus sp. TF02A-30]RBY84444.1 hypothetical protein DQ241_17275 [Blastococcus sp. TF02A-30]